MRRKGERWTAKGSKNIYFLPTGITSRDGKPDPMVMVNPSNQLWYIFQLFRHSKKMLQVATVSHQSWPSP